VEGSEVRGNQGGGIDVRGDARFSMVNNVIVDNGEAGLSGSDFGGVSIGQTVEDDSFLHNTVIANRRGDDVLAFAGVDCSAESNMSAHSNIVYGNAGSNLAPSCNLTYSNIEGGPSDGDNIDEDPLFVDVSEGDFHLLPDSPCIDAADPASTVDVDIDGDARPQGAAADMGADEVVP
jgi:hypothetical protein